ncbi:MAG: hypothetical protein ACI4LT_02735 [Treponema sp.]
MNECGGWSAVSAERRKAWFLRQQKCAHILKKNETPEEAFLSAEEKQTVKLLVAEMNESEKTELIYAVGKDWNNITPFLIREFLWRKQYRRIVQL